MWRVSETSMHRLVGIVALALALAPGAACSRAPHLDEERETIYRAETAVTIRVVNRSQLDATIYLVHDGTRDRLGTVTAASAASFPVRTRSLASGEFVLLAEPIGARRRASTEGLSIAQGTTFTWTLDSDFSRGAVLVQ
jgi:hypothetical protein